MKFNELLPVGSVVLLDGAIKKIVIIGIMQVKHMEDGSDVIYDYLGVPYPEGYMGMDTGLLFNHEKIKEIFFMGYSNDERDSFVSVIQMMMDETDKYLGKNK